MPPTRKKAETMEAEIVEESAATGQDIARRSYDNDTLRELSSWEDVIALVNEVEGGIDDVAHVLGDGFALLRNKNLLIGQPFLMMEWHFYPGDFGSNFVAARVAVRNPDGGISKYIVNDGSTGLGEQLAEYTGRTGKRGGLYVKNGLRASEYDFCEECRTAERDCADPTKHKATGEYKKATTFYLDTSL